MLVFAYKKRQENEKKMRGGVFVCCVFVVPPIIQTLVIDR